MEDIFKFATLVPRVASHNIQPDYLEEVEEMEELASIREEIFRRVTQAIIKV